jgi:hypothetical protein
MPHPGFDAESMLFNAQPHGNPRYATPPAYAQAQPSRLDKLQQLDSMDRGDDRGGGGQNNMAEMMHMLQTLYGIQHEQEQAPQQKQAAETEDAYKQAGIQRLNAETEHLQKPGKYDVPDFKTLSEMHATGRMPDADYYTALTQSDPYKSIGEAGLKRISDAEAVRSAGRAQQDAMMKGSPTAPDAGASTAATAGQHLSDSIRHAVGNPVMDLPAKAYNTVEGGYDYLTGVLGLPPANSRMHTYDDMMSHPYGSMFYDPTKPEQARPLPVARSSQPTQ